MSKEELDTLFAERLSELIHSSSYILSDMEESVGKTSATISRYASGEISGVKRSTIVKIANFFNVSPAWLAGLSNEKYIKKTDELGNIVVPIPLIGTVKAGYDYLAQENWEGTVDLAKKIADTGEFFALKIKGDSMIPAFYEGDIVIIRKQNDCENNQVAVVIVNGDEGTLKKVKKTDEGIILQPFNSAYSPVMYTNKEIKEVPIVIAGIFHELRRTEIKF